MELPCQRFGRFARWLCCMLASRRDVLQLPKSRTSSCLWEATESTCASARPALVCASVSMKKRETKACVARAAGASRARTGRRQATAAQRRNVTRTGQRRKCDLCWRC
ncbi:hypothetical protein EJB05_46820, partial [Eragrostis curvula]